MKQNLIIKEMTENDCSFNEIEETLHRMFGESSYKSSTIYEKMRLVRCQTDITKRKDYQSNRIDQELANNLLSLLEEFPFASVRMMAMVEKKHPATVHRYLTQVLHLKYKLTRWLPHKLTEKNLKDRVTQSKQLFDILEDSKSCNYRNIITGDQSWILYNYGPRGKWCLDSEENPEFERDRITHEKFMLTVIWGVWGFYVIDMLPNGMSYNSTYFIEHILTVLNEKKNEIWPKSGRKKIWLHLDNCRVHNSKQTLIEMEKIPYQRTPHPPYSPDLAPSDFYLFGRVKKALEGLEFDSPQEVFDKIVEILEEISTEERLAVFQEWQNRCHFVFSNRGKYFKK